MCYVAQESLEEKSDMEKNEEIIAEKDAQVVTKERLKEVNLGSDQQEPRPISINSKLSKEEKLELILSLKEFKDVFA